jgi:hypothetical protein
MTTFWALLLPSLTGFQAPAPPPAALPIPVIVQAPAPQPLLRAQYAWGYAGGDGTGKGTLNVLIEPGSGRTVLELQGLGERLMLLEGSTSEGFRLQIPRQKVDQRAAALNAIPLPFFPQLGSPAAFYRLLTEGAGPGVKVTKKDKNGPVKLRYDGKDDRGREVTVWLERTRWEPEGAK